jgi:tetratricopeptide (TPR) repeat protein
VGAAAAVLGALIVGALLTVVFHTSDPAPIPEQTASAAVEERLFPALYRLEADAAARDWTAESLSEVARRWRAAGDLDAAAAFYQRARRVGAAEAGLLRSLAEIELERESWAAARDALVAYQAALDPNSSDARWAAFQLSLILAPIDADAALTATRAAALEPAYASVTRLLLPILERGQGTAAQVGAALMQAELWAYAEHAFAAALDQTDDPRLGAEMWAYLSLARDRGGKDGSAAMARAVALAPDSAVVRYLQGLHLRHIGDDRASLDALIQAVALNPQDPALFAELGMSYQLMGDSESAERWLREAVRLSQNDPRFRALLDEFRFTQQDALTNILAQIAPALLNDVVLPPNYGRGDPR